MKYLILIMAALSVAACERPQLAHSTPSFDVGSMVQFRAFPIRGMVIYAYCRGRRADKGPPPPCMYDVRTLAPTMTTNTRVFGQDGPVTGNPTALIKGVREFELTLEQMENGND